MITKIYCIKQNGETQFTKSISLTKILNKLRNIKGFTEYENRVLCLKLRSHKEILIVDPMPLTATQVIHEIQEELKNDFWDEGEKLQFKECLSELRDLEREEDEVE